MTEAIENIPLVLNTSSKQALMLRANSAIDEIRPFLEIDGGNVELVDITEDMILQVRWVGNCIGCYMSAMTMKAGVEQAVKSRVPEILSVVAINQTVFL